MGVAGPTHAHPVCPCRRTQEPRLNAPGVKQALTNAGLTEADYAQILTTNPFASPNAAIDPDRFLLCSQSCPYEPPFEANGPVDTTTFVQNNTVTTASTKTVQDKYGSASKCPAASAAYSRLSVGGSLQWTNTSSSASSASLRSLPPSRLQAHPSATQAPPTCWSIGTRSIARSCSRFPLDLPGAFGTLTDSAGLPLAKRP